MPSFPTLYQIKPAFQRLLQPILNACIRHGISANALTAMALGLSILAGAVLWATAGAIWVLLLYPPLLLVRMSLNALDGLVARQTNTSSKAGMVFNEASDIIADIAMYAPLAIIAALNPWLVISVVATGVLAELSGILRLYRRGERSYHGPLGKSDRAAAVGLLTILIVIGLPTLALNSFLSLMIGLHLITAVNRYR